MEETRSDLYPALARATLLAAGLVVVLWTVYSIAPVLLASFLALILAIALNAPILWLQRRGVKRALGAVISMAGLLLIGLGVGWLIVPRLVQEIPALLDRIPVLIADLGDQVTAIFGDHPDVERQMERAVDWSLGLAGRVFGYADQILGAAVIGVFVIALALYIAVNLPSLLAWYTRSMPTGQRDPAVRAFARFSKMIIGWIVASVIFGSIKAVGALAFLLLMEIPGAPVWALLAFFGAFVPRVGFYFMTIPPVLVAFAVSPLAALWTLVFYVVFAEILGNFVMPQIYAETMRLSAVLILFMTLAMGYAFGVIGVLIAAPVAGFLTAYYEEFYLARQPEDDRMPDRVRAMLERAPEEA